MRLASLASITLSMMPALAWAAPVVVVAERADSGSLAAITHARARIRAETALVDEPTEDAAATARKKALGACSGSPACMEKVLKDSGGGLALYLRVDADALTVEQVLVAGDKTTEAHTQTAIARLGVVAALDRHLDEHVIVPLGNADAAAKARARLGLVPPLASPASPPPPPLAGPAGAAPQAPMVPALHRGGAEPTVQCYGARTDDCPAN